MKQILWIEFREIYFESYALCASKESKVEKRTDNECYFILERK